MPKLRVIFCTYPSIYSEQVLQILLRAQHIEVTGIVHSTRILRKRGFSPWDNLVMLWRTGIHYALYLFMVTDLFRLLYRLSGFRTFKAHASIPRLDTRNINDAEGIAFVRNCRADVMLSAHFNQLIGAEILSLPPRGCLNIHPGLLPGYRGVDPVVYALLAGEQNLTATLHYQDFSFDTGRILSVSTIPVTQDSSVLSLNLQLFATGAHLFTQAMQEADNASQSSPQEGLEGYGSWPEPATIRTLRRQGRKLLKLRHYRQALRSLKK